MSLLFNLLGYHHLWHISFANFVVIDCSFSYYSFICWDGKDLCQADSKSLSMQWSLLLPTSDTLQARYGQTIPPFCECNQTLIFLSIWYCFVTVFFNLYFHRMHDATLMTSLLFDPCLKVMTMALILVYKCLVLNFYLNFKGHIFWYNILDANMWYMMLFWLVSCSYFI